MPPRQIVFVGCLPMPTRLAEAGGMGIVGVDLLNGLSARGHGVRVLAPLSDSDPNPALVGLDERIDISTYRVPKRVHEPTSQQHFEMHGARIRAALPAMLSARPADMVLVGHHAYLGGFPDALARCNTRWGAWVHGTLAPIMMFGEGPAPEAIAQQILERLRQADRIIGVADHVAASLKDIGMSSVVAVPNGVDIRRFCPRAPKPDLRAAMRLADDTIVVLHASNLKTVKRIPDLVDSALRSISDDPRLTYVILGDGPLKPEIEREFSAAGKTAQLRLQGWVERGSIPDYLAIADIVVMTSRAEGSPLALIEAQAAGCAVIASDNAACRELIDDGETGLLFPVGNVEALSERTLRLAADPDWRARIGTNARRFAERHHDVQLMTGRFETLIEGLVEAAVR